MGSGFHCIKAFALDGTADIAVTQEGDCSDAELFAVALKADDYGFTMLQLVESSEVIWYSRLGHFSK